MTKQLLEFHRNIIKDGHVSSTKGSNIVKTDIIEKTKVDNDGLKSIDHKQIFLLLGHIKLGYEALFAIMSLEGHQVRVFLFILAYLRDMQTACFRWNALEVSDYLKYYESATGESLKPTYLRNVLNDLRSYKFIKRIKREHYMINPAYMGLSNKSTLRSLINDYKDIKETIALRPVKKSKK
ncbi:MAG: hypothetical protein FJX80_08480 [Bacteroidetes bacterium]|nr:hypothetical protein [Bacteroidota bacterium]